jgi:all-trans-retinol dehydrogenase (NAD+)
MKTLEGKNVVITGGASGIGKKMALRIARQKANLAIVDIDGTRLMNTQKELETFRVRIHTYRCDVSQQNQIEQIADRIKNDFNFIDVLINNAAVVTGKPVLDTRLEDFKKTLDTDLMAVIFMTKQFLSEMVARNTGHIVNVASAAGLVGVPGMADYCAAKFGVVGFSEVLRREMKKFGYHGVKVSCICPSFITTGMFAGVRPPLFSTWLGPDRVAYEIVRTIMRERAYLRIPFIVKLIPLLKCLPIPLFDRLGKMMGLDRAMDNFRGH